MALKAPARTHRRSDLEPAKPKKPTAPKSKGFRLTFGEDESKAGYSLRSDPQVVNPQLTQRNVSYIKYAFGIFHFEVQRTDDEQSRSPGADRAAR